MGNEFLASLKEAFSEVWLFVACSAPTVFAIFAIALFFSLAVYAIAALSAVGVWYAIAALSGEYGTGELALIGVCLLELSLFGYAVLAYVFAVRKKKEREREKREELLRRESYFTLPDRENEFLRERLQTRLKIPPEGKAQEEEVEKTEIRLEYARSLLTKLKATSLSASDRLETENLSKLLTRYALSEEKENARAIGECLMKILKLSAKYAVEYA